VPSSLGRINGLLAYKVLATDRPFYAGGAAAVYVLRKKRPDLVRPYRVWGYPLTPAIFLAAALFLLGNALVTGTALVVFVILLLGIPAYWVWKPFALEKLLLQKN
jgi:APA family basic amino acid/polyamine antiporter